MFEFLDIHRAITYFQATRHLKRSSKGWFSFDCPFCVNGEGKRKAAVHFDHELVKCWSCQYKETILTFVMDVEGLTSQAARDYILTFKQHSAGIAKLSQMEPARAELKHTGLTLPYGYTSIMDGDTMLAERARTYMGETRRLDLEVLDRLGVGFSDTHAPEGFQDYFGYIIIPFRNRGKLSYYLGRDYIGGFPRYKNPTVEGTGIAKSDLFFNEDVLDLCNVGFLVEGAIDAMTIGKYGFASMGWALSNTQRSKILSSGLKMLVMVSDPGFYEVAIQTALPFLGHKRLRVVNMDTLGGDVNKVGLEAMMGEFERTPELTYKMAIDVLMNKK